jgi:superfamily II DNA helicase RecQ
MAERVGALQVEAAPGGGRAGRLQGGRLTPEQREDLAGQVQAELHRRHRALDAAVAYVRGDACRRRVFLHHFDDPSEPVPEERCCDVCEPPGDLDVAAPVAAPARARPDEPPLDVDERRTFEALKAWRGALAKELGWPAFRVASNRTLEGIARRAPRDARALESVRGVGPWLMEGHAVDILEVVAAAGEGAP